MKGDGYGKRTEKDPGGKNHGKGGIDRGSHYADGIGEEGAGGALSGEASERAGDCQQSDRGYRLTAGGGCRHTTAISG